MAKRKKRSEEFKREAVRLLPPNPPGGFGQQCLT
jgi:hypothetical protein